MPVFPSCGMPRALLWLWLLVILVLRLVRLTLLRRRCRPILRLRMLRCGRWSLLTGSSFIPGWRSSLVPCFGAVRLWTFVMRRFSRTVVWVRLIRLRPVGRRRSRTFVARRFSRAVVWVRLIHLRPVRLRCWGTIIAHWLSRSIVRSRLRGLAISWTFVARWRFDRPASWLIRGSRLRSGRLRCVCPRCVRRRVSRAVCWLICGRRHGCRPRCLDDIHARRRGRGRSHPLQFLPCHGLSRMLREHLLPRCKRWWWRRRCRSRNHLTACHRRGRRSHSAGRARMHA